MERKAKERAEREAAKEQQMHLLEGVVVVVVVVGVVEDEDEDGRRASTPPVTVGEQANAPVDIPRLHAFLYRQHAQPLSISHR